jgi:hypothetical protein
MLNNMLIDVNELCNVLKEFIAYCNNNDNNTTMKDIKSFFFRINAIIFYLECQQKITTHTTDQP